MLIQGTLTAEDCVGASVNDSRYCEHCAVARFLKRMTGKTWSVGSRYAWMSGRAVVLPSDVQWIVHQFDEGLPVEGREVALEIPDALLQH